jgi:hypothetical protein
MSSGKESFENIVFFHNCELRTHRVLLQRYYGRSRLNGSELEVIEQIWAIINWFRVGYANPAICKFSLLLTLSLSCIFPSVCLSVFLSVCLFVLVASPSLAEPSESDDRRCSVMMTPEVCGCANEPVCSDGCDENVLQLVSYLKSVLPGTIPCSEPVATPVTAPTVNVDAENDGNAPEPTLDDPELLRTTAMEVSTFI